MSASTHPIKSDAEISRRNLRTGLYAMLFALFMLGLGYAAVPLYDLFCRVTGFAGTTQVASEDDAARAAAAGVGRTISVRFDASTARGMPWTFKPDQVTETVRIGQRDIATYTAINNSDAPITGTATFNVEPAQAGLYFQKVQCFCFTEQTLAPGEEVRMPVLFYVDPAIEDDEFMADVEQITLSYTFHRAKEPVSNGRSAETE